MAQTPFPRRIRRHGTIGVGEDRPEVLGRREHRRPELHAAGRDFLDRLGDGHPVAVGEGHDSVVAVVLAEDDQVGVDPQLFAAESVQADHRESSWGAVARRRVVHRGRSASSREIQGPRDSEGTGFRPSRRALRERRSPCVRPSRRMTRRTGRQRLTLTRSASISSDVVMTRVLAWKPRWARTRLVNSVARSTFEPSSEPGAMVPNCPVPARPATGSPDVSVVHVEVVGGLLETLGVGHVGDRDHADDPAVAIGVLGGDRTVGTEVDLVQLGAGGTVADGDVHRGAAGRTG